MPAKAPKANPNKKTVKKVVAKKAKTGRAAKA